MDGQTTSRDKQWIFDWLPLALIVGGLGLNWIGLDRFALLTYSGFIAYGTLGLVEISRNKNLRKKILKFLKIATLLLIVIIGVISILGNPTYFVALLALVLLDRIILTANRIEQYE